LYTHRFYRGWTAGGKLHAWKTVLGESDLEIHASKPMKGFSQKALARCRRDIEAHIRAFPVFGETMVPVGTSPEGGVAREMEAAAETFGTGPMAAVAGAVAQGVGEQLMLFSPTVIVENGGDVWAVHPGRLRFLVYPGEESPFRGNLAFSVDCRRGMAVCTSSGRMGPSLSLGSADTVTAVHPSGAMADAAATALANMIRSEADVERVISLESCRRRLKALVICAGDCLGVWGDLRMEET
jgi:hypothetical protein